MRPSAKLSVVLNAQSAASSVETAQPELFTCARFSSAPGPFFVRVPARCSSRTAANLSQTSRTAAYASHTARIDEEKTRNRGFATTSFVNNGAMKIFEKYPMECSSYF